MRFLGARAFRGYLMSQVVALVNRAAEEEARAWFRSSAHARLMGRQAEAR